MEHSKYYNFNLPSSDVDDIADVNKLSENFREVDRILGEEVIKQSEILQNYDPQSTSPVSGAAVKDAVETSVDDILFFNEYTGELMSVDDELKRLENQDLAADHRISELDTRTLALESDMPLKASTEYVDESIDAATPKWKTVLDVTLTEAQGGVSSLLLAMENADAIANANKMRVFITFPVTQSWSNNAFTLTAYLSDETKKNYKVPILRESNVASSTNADFVASSYVDISDFTIRSGYRTYCATSPKPNNYFTAPVNSFTTSRLLSGGYPSEGILSYAPYLEIVPTSNTITFEKGTRVFVEVQ